MPKQPSEGHRATTVPNRTRQPKPRIRSERKKTTSQAPNTWEFDVTVSSAPSVTEYPLEGRRHVDRSLKFLDEHRPSYARKVHRSAGIQAFGLIGAGPAARTAQATAKNAVHNAPFPAQDSDSLQGNYSTPEMPSAGPSSCQTSPQQWGTPTWNGGVEEPPCDLSHYSFAREVAPNLGLTSAEIQEYELYENGLFDFDNLNCSDPALDAFQNEATPHTMGLRQPNEDPRLTTTGGVEHYPQRTSLSQIEVTSSHPAMTAGHNTIKEMRHDIQGEALPHLTGESLVAAKAELENILFMLSNPPPPDVLADPEVAQWRRLFEETVMRATGDYLNICGPVRDGLQRACADARSER